MSGHDDLHRPGTRVPSDRAAPFTDQLRLAVAAYLARSTGASRQHTESDLRCYLPWRAQRGLDPFTALRPHLELYIRRMQEIRRFKPSTVSRRFSVVAGFYKTCVIDGLLGHSPAEHVRRPAVPPESPTLGFTHLQFEALLTAARNSKDPCLSPWWPCSGCSACGSSKPLPRTSPTWAKNTVTNAVRHAEGPIEVRVSYACGDLWAEVHDQGIGRPVRQHATTDDEQGRGLELLDGLIGLHGGARGVVDDSDGPGKTVYVAVSLAVTPGNVS